MKGSAIVLASLAIGSAAVAQPEQRPWQMQPVPLETRWARDVSPTNALPEYPRPQMVRPQWMNLNGLWDYAITSKDAAAPHRYAGQILVPYPLGSALSGVTEPLQVNQRLWYRRTVSVPALEHDERVLLHFGVLDWQARVLVNGKTVSDHQSRYQPFTIDITDALRTGDNELIVSATSGVWQTVWMETVPAVSITALQLIPVIDSGILRVLVTTSQPAPGYTIEARATTRDHVVSVARGPSEASLVLPIAQAHWWSPADPFLYDLSVQLLHNGRPIDSVRSYFGMRQIEVRRDSAGVHRVFLNHQPIYILGVLDQAHWPDGLSTAPTDGALKFDIAAAKAMGFNTIRKYNRIEPDRWYYWCDRAGMFVWQDMPRPNDGVVAQQVLRNHPSIVDGLTARMFGDFGRVVVAVARHDWDTAGSRAEFQLTPATLAAAYDTMTTRIKTTEPSGLSGSIYTELCDVKNAEDGLLTYDRAVIKVPLEKLRAANARLVPVAPLSSSDRSVLDDLAQAH